MSAWDWVVAALYVAVAIAAFAFLHSFGGAFGDMPLYQELLIATFWPVACLILAVYIAVGAVA